ncbi:MAG: hypothetical protein ABIU11_06400 [Chitinophagaceae bacterium]
MTKRIFIPILFVFLFLEAYCQYPQLSIATDVGVQRSLKKNQQYWALGQTINALFHLSSNDGIYVWFAYYSNGRFKNDLIATAKGPIFFPAQVNYTNDAKMRMKHFSVGWRKYLVGASDAERNWNLYAYAGLGILMGRVENIHSAIIDTVIYNLPVKSGTANFKRLTLDLGVGWELPLAGGFSFYVEGRAWIPTTDYPSKYIFINDNAPVAGMVNAGLRILFD